MTTNEGGRRAAWVVLHDEESLKDVSHQENTRWDGAGDLSHRRGKTSGGALAMRQLSGDLGVAGLVSQAPPCHREPLGLAHKMG
jgi:hypothetical protein